MQSVLQDLLQRHSIPEKRLTPVYNPRIVLGQLAPTKCKIMASKKVRICVVYSCEYYGLFCVETAMA